jgi:hypothetical protein
LQVSVSARAVFAGIRVKKEKGGFAGDISTLTGVQIPLGSF